jgi:hypothetical protein
MNYIIISCYTENTPYEKEVQNLIKSVNLLGLKSHIQPVSSLGSWEKNCQHKARYILETMEQFDQNIVWVDADAVIKKEPVLFDQLQADVAYYYMEHRKEVLSGTLFLRNNEKARQLLQSWIKINDTNTLWDQKNLQQALDSHLTLEKEILPETYCKIFDNKHQKLKDPVIVHYQASRRFKRQINGPRKKRVPSRNRRTAVRRLR